MFSCLSVDTAWMTIAAVDSGAGGCLGADAVNLEKV